jgi:hypothetical protein
MPRFLIYILVVFIISLASSVGYSQTTEATIFDEATIVYKKSVFGGPLLHTNGWGGQLAFGKGKTAFKSRIWQFDLVGMKHPKEIRTLNQNTNNTRSYVLGKLNTLTILRAGWGVRNVKFDKIRKSGVAIGYTYRIGPAIGFVKPIYLEIAEGPTSVSNPSSVERYDPSIHFSNNIIGRAGLFRGIDEMTLRPGIHGAFALNFEYDPEREGMKGIEVGATVDFFPGEEVEIMAFADNTNLFFNFYINLQFGKKFND